MTTFAPNIPTSQMQALIGRGLNCVQMSMFASPFVSGFINTGSNPDSSNPIIHSSLAQDIPVEHDRFMRAAASKKDYSVLTQWGQTQVSSKFYDGSFMVVFDIPLGGDNKFGVSMGTTIRQPDSPAFATGIQYSSTLDQFEIQQLAYLQLFDEPKDARIHERLYGFGAMAIDCGYTFLEQALKGQGDFIRYQRIMSSLEKGELTPELVFHIAERFFVSAEIMKCKIGVGDFFAIKRKKPGEFDASDIHFFQLSESEVGFTTDQTIPEGWGYDPAFGPSKVPVPTVAVGYKPARSGTESATMFIRRNIQISGARPDSYEPIIATLIRGAKNHPGLFG